MNSATNSKALSVGTHVVFTDEATELFGLGETGRLMIHEIIDVRGANGSYIYRIAPVTSAGVSRMEAQDAFDVDLREVGR